MMLICVGDREQSSFLPDHRRAERYVVNAADRSYAGAKIKTATIRKYAACPIARGTEAVVQ